MQVDVFLVGQDEDNHQLEMVKLISTWLIKWKLISTVVMVGLFFDEVQIFSGFFPL